MRSTEEFGGYVRVASAGVVRYEDILRCEAGGRVTGLQEMEDSLLNSLMTQLGQLPLEGGDAVVAVATKVLLSLRYATRLLLLSHYTLSANQGSSLLLVCCGFLRGQWCLFIRKDDTKSVPSKSSKVCMKMNFWSVYLVQ